MMAGGAVLTLPPPIPVQRVPRFYSSDDPPWCRVRATHRENRYTFRPTFASQPQARAEKPPPITNLYDCTARKRQCHQPPRVRVF